TGLAAWQTLRSLILMRVKGWDYRELRERIADGFTLRRFTQFYCRFGAEARRLPSYFSPANSPDAQGRQRFGGKSGGGSWARRWRAAQSRLDSRADGHPSPDRQHPVMGCGARDHAFDR